MINPVLEVGESGVTMPPGCEWFPAGTRFRMLRDWMLIRVLDWQPSRWIKVEYSGRPLRGVIAFIGPGAYRRRWYRNECGEIDRVGEIGGIIPCDARVGDVVEIGGLELRGYGFCQIMIGDVLHLRCQEADVCVVASEWTEPAFPEAVRARVDAAHLVKHDRNMERKRGVDLKKIRDSRGLGSR